MNLMITILIKNKYTDLDEQNKTKYNEYLLYLHYNYFLKFEYTFFVHFTTFYTNKMNSKRKIKEKQPNALSESKRSEMKTSAAIVYMSDN